MANRERKNRNCYCGTRGANDKALQEGIPQGYCGLCEICGKPGHVRHHPGAVPATGSWCDFHYALLAIFHPLTIIGFFVWLLFFAAIILGAIFLISG